jgi:anti-sigma-K factor RskA
MTESKEHYDEDLDLRVSPRLSEDLHTFFNPHLSVPPEIDRAIMDRAHQHLVRRQSARGGRRLLRWAASIAAVAAVIILAFSLNLTQKPGPTTTPSFIVEAQAVDIDENGRVDILDAFKLARHVEFSERTKKEWDINGDGLINRDDVDLVAFAAVRLDKGVL